MIWVMHLILGTGLFVIGTAIGSFLNVCIYRLAWQKSVIWPSSRCPACLEAISSRDNIPILSWLALRGECRNCGAAISARYLFVETLVGLLFVGVYLVDVAHAASLVGTLPAQAFLQMIYHLLLVAFLVVATFIDYDLFIIPDSVTVPGMLAGLALGALIPGIRPDPATASTHWGGLGAGLLGLLIGGGVVWFVRIVGGKAFGREAMGFGDVTLLGMVGAFLGWQAAVLTFFLAAFVGLVPALVKILLNLLKYLSGGRISAADREIPFGPCLSVAAIVLLYSWPWVWAGWAKPMFTNLGVAIQFLTGLGLVVPAVLL